MSSSTVSSASSYTAVQQRIVGCLRVFLGEQAAPLYDTHGRSLQRLAAFARDSSLPGCQELSTGLALAQALLAEAMTDFLRLHIADQAYESFVVVLPGGRGRCSDAVGFVVETEDDLPTLASDRP